MSEEHKLAIKDTIIKTIKKEERTLLFRGIRRFTSIVIVSTIICHVLELDKSKYTSPLITCTLATTIVELYFRKKKLYSILGSNYFEKCKQKILEPKELELRIQCSNLKSILLNLGFIEFDGGIKDYEFLEVLSNKQYKRFKNNLKINRNQKYISELNKSEQLFKYKLYQVITIKELKKEDII